MKCLSHASLLLGLTVMTLPALAAGTEAAPTTAIRVGDFLNSIGTQSAISKRGENLPQTIASVKYLGVRWMRSGIEGDVPIEDVLALHRQAGVRFSWGLLSGNTDLDKLVATGRQLADAGALLAFEGLNEPNNWGITYGGQEGGRDKSWRPVARIQRDLYEAVKRDPALKRYPVFSLSEAGA